MKTTPSHVALIFHPGMVVCVDDNKTYLESLSQFLTKVGIAHKMFTNPNKAIAYLHDSVEKYYWINRTIELTDEDDQYNVLKGNNLELKLDKLLDIVYGADRFKEIFCACFDHKMPEMTGLDSISEIADLPFQKAMLSGRFDTESAVSEFNKKTFDIFINKHFENAMKEILKNIKRAQLVYFKQYSKPLVEHHGKLNQVLLNHDFESFFYDLVEKNNYCEGYCIEDFGSYLLIDNNGKSNILAIVSDADIEAYYETALMADTKPKPDLLDKLKNKKAFPFFYKQSIDSLEPKDWANYLLPAKKVKGTDIYYSLIDDVEDYGIDTRRIVGYRQFLAKQDPFEFA